ncbi:MAG: hypothetical protein WBG71_03435 [Leeuwenhoekiella sp.]
MATTEELIKEINGFSLDQRLKIIEEILRSIRNEKGTSQEEPQKVVKKSSDILDLPGMLSKEEAAIYKEAVKESRKIDHDEW